MQSSARNRHILTATFFAGVVLVFAANEGISGTVIGNIESVSNQATGAPVLNGWTCEIGNPNPLTLHAYMGGPYGQGNLFGYQLATNVNRPDVAAACGGSTNNTYGFKVALPTNDVPASLFVAGIRSDGSGTYIGGSGVLGIPLANNTGPQVISLLNPEPGSSGWSVDNVNYFSTWQCQSSAGLTHISRLNILPSSTLASVGDRIHWNQWKDSLVAGAGSSGGYPILFFTFGDIDPGSPLFTMLKAKYDTTSGAWQIFQYLSDPNNVSSHAGTETDYIYNKYGTPGWGPFANPTSSPPPATRIPGVCSQNIAGVCNQNELWGTGPLGLSTIRSAHQPYQDYDPNTTSCLVMNPSLYNYDSNGVPHGLIATLWTEEWTSTSSQSRHPVDCVLPPGTPGTTQVNGNATIPRGPYIFRYQDATVGWQLINIGLVENQLGEVGIAMNADPNKDGRYGTFVRADWSGKIMQVNESTTSTILDCSSNSSQQLHFSEASRGPDSSYYFLVDETPTDSSKPTFSHDIFVLH